MSATGLDVFDKTLQTTNIWLKDIGPIDTEEAARAVFAVLDAHIASGEIEDIKGTLPAELRRLWPDKT